MLFGGFGDVVEVHDTAHEGEVAGAGLEGANVCFFVVQDGLVRVRCWGKGEG